MSPIFGNRHILRKFIECVITNSVERLDFGLVEVWVLLKFFGCFPDTSPDCLRPV